MEDALRIIIDNFDDSKEVVATVKQQIMSPAVEESKGNDNEKKPEDKLLTVSTKRKPEEEVEESPSHAKKPRKDGDGPATNETQEMELDNPDINMLLGQADDDDQHFVAISSPFYSSKTIPISSDKTAPTSLPASQSASTPRDTTVLATEPAGAPQDTTVSASQLPGTPQDSTVPARENLEGR